MLALKQRIDDPGRQVKRLTAEQNKEMKEYLESKLKTSAN